MSQTSMIGTVRRSVKSVFIFGLYASLLVGCNQTANPPSFSGVNQKSDYEACRGADFKLEEQTPKSFRALFNCVNTNGTIQPYVDLLSKISDADLQIILTGFEKQFRPFLNQVLDLLGRMSQRGLLKDFAQNLAVLAESGQLKALADVLREAYSDGVGYSDPRMIEFHKTLLDLVTREELKPSVLALARMFDQSSTWQTAAYLSRVMPDERLTSAFLVQWMAQAVPQFREQKTFESLLQLASDSSTMAAAASFSDAELEGFGFFMHSLWGEGLGEVHIPQIQRLFRTLNKEILCFDKSGKGYYFSNVLEVDLKEVLRRRGNKDSLDHFYGIEGPFLFGVTLRDCDIPKDVTKNYASVISLVEKGATLGISAAKIPFQAPGRLQTLVSFITSPVFGQYQNVQKLSTLRGTDIPMLRAYRSLSSEDQKSMSRLLTYISSANIRGETLGQWISSRLNTELGGRAKVHLMKLKAPRDTLYDLIQMTVGEDQELEYALRTQAALTVSQTKSIVPMLDVAQKLLSQKKDLVTSVVASFAKTLANQRGGWGAMLSVFAETSELAQEKPMQEWLKILLSDEKYFAEFRRVVFLASQKSEFDRAMEFTSKFAVSQDFEGFLKFMIEVFAYSTEKGLTTPPNPNGYKRPASRQYQWSDPKPLVGVPPRFEVESCKKLTGSIFDGTGSGLHSMLKCVSTESDDTGLGRVAEILEKTGQLNFLQDYLSRRLFSDQQIHSFLADMDRWQNSGDVNRFFEISSVFADPKYGFIQTIDSVLYKILSNTRSEAFEGVGRVLADPQMPRAAAGVLDALSLDKASPFFSSQDDYVMPVANTEELVRQAKQRLPSASEDHIRAELYKFTRRSDAYYFEQQVYRPAAQSVVNEDIWSMLFQLLRTNPDEKTGDLEEVLGALRDLAEWDRIGKINLTEFLRWGITNLKPVPYYVADANHPHIRFVTPLDQLEILIANANISIFEWIPIVGADHMGTHFQIEVANSRNLNETLSDLRGELNMGMTAGNLGLISKLKYNNLRNGLESFSILEEAHKRGHLIILQRIYQGLMKATPSKYKNKQDPVLNHISLIHQPSKWAGFARLVTMIRHVEEQGQLNHLVNAVLQIVRTIPPSDYAVVRKGLSRWVSRDPGQPSHMDLMINYLSSASVADGTFKYFKDLSYHGLYAWPIVLGRSSGLFELLKDVDLVTLRTVLTELDEEAQKGLDANSFKLVTNLAKMDSDSGKSLRVLTSILMEPQGFGSSYFYALGSPWLNLYENDRASYDPFANSLKAIFDGGAVTKKGSLQLLKNLLTNYNFGRTVIGESLKDRNDREALRKALLEVLKQNGGRDLLQSFIFSYKSGEIQDILTLVNKYRRPAR